MTGKALQGTFLSKDSRGKGSLQKLERKARLVINTGGVSWLPLIKHISSRLQYFLAMRGLKKMYQYSQQDSKS